MRVLPWALVIGAMLCAWSVGLFTRTLWTPDEPREADIAWRMSWQTDRSVPVLAGESFCEKPPLTYWVAAAAIRAFGPSLGAMRLPNLLYGLIAVVSAGVLASRFLAPPGPCVAAAAVGSFMLGYQAIIWLATDAPAFAFSTLALAGLAHGFYARGRASRIAGYTAMHLGLALAFMSKSLLACLTPISCLLTLIVWDQRWRELLRPSFYAGLPIAAALIVPWIMAVYSRPDGAELLRVFFWNNLAGRIMPVNAPAALQYSSAHTNYPGKYLVELPLTVWPWTLLLAAALYAGWRRITRKRSPSEELSSEIRVLRFSAAAIIPALIFLSVSATARNVYAVSLLPGFALLGAWWSLRTSEQRTRWDVTALRMTAVMIGMMACLVPLAVAWLAYQASRSSSRTDAGIAQLAIAVSGGAIAALAAWHAAARARTRATSMTLAWCLAALALLSTAPVAALYSQINPREDLPALGRAIERATRGRELYLLAPDETTRAFVDLYVTTRARTLDASSAAHGLGAPSTTDTVPPAHALLLVRARSESPAPPGWRPLAQFSLPQGRGYSLWMREPTALSARPAL